MTDTFDDLRAFLRALRDDGDLRTVDAPVSPHLEVSALADLVLRRHGPALLLRRPQGCDVPLLTNLFGTRRRVERALGVQGVEGLRALGRQLAQLREPPVPHGWQDLAQLRPLAGAAWHMRPKVVRSGPVHDQIWLDEGIDLERWPVCTCWPGDAGPLITWGLVITRGPRHPRHNIGVYRVQVIDRRRVIVRWLPHRGGALDFADHRQRHPGEPFPVAIAIGADPATMLAAVMPIPDTLSEFQFAGVLRGARSEVVRARTVPLWVPARAELVLEGWIHPKPSHPSGWEHALEGPFGDHTGYVNEAAEFPVLTLSALTHRDDPIYLSTHTGRPPDEPSVLGGTLNELFVPLLQQQLPEVADCYLPPAACSYRIAIVAIRKQYPGHAKRVMMGLWSLLRQFLYTKMIVVVDDDIDIRNIDDVLWAISTRADPVRDSWLIERTPIDELDFAAPSPALGGKLGLDATRKWPDEAARRSAPEITPDPQVRARVEALAASIGLA
ncbi:UbiD family decarboxylase [Tepidimonas taiwanensis]|jgi:4-hydroxy-3-polyprenylbenzoate decarboxylase|uniref:UbiD family decarboxylase n=1 Tax=Tepidimonas taiwanensis TaxID=307486 RepID=UPI0005BAA5A8|nr:UbiD family decarboxylase [Tepidimonas taiwanensis]